MAIFAGVLGAGISAMPDGGWPEFIGFFLFAVFMVFLGCEFFYHLLGHEEIHARRESLTITPRRNLFSGAKVYAVDRIVDFRVLTPEDYSDSDGVPLFGYAMLGFKYVDEQYAGVSESGPASGTKVRFAAGVEEEQAEELLYTIKSRMNFHREN